MRTLIFAAAISAAVSIAQGQTTVTLTNVLDIAVTHQSYSATYDPAADKFLIGGAADIEIFNGLTGADEGTLSSTGITPSGLGFFAITASATGAIYAYEDSGADFWKWNSITDTAPAKVFDTAPFERIGATAVTSTGTIVAFTGTTDSGPVDFYFDTRTSFTFTESVNLLAKSGLAINGDATLAFTVADVGALPLGKFVKKNGEWAQDTVFVPPVIQGGPMAYDGIHNILFTIPAGDGAPMMAIDGTSGNTLASLPVVTALSATSGYNGGYCAPTTNGGIVWLAGRHATDGSQAALYKFTYTVTPESKVHDWILY